MGVVALVVALTGCDRARPADTPIVIAAVGEPESVLPPLAVETVARDIGDLVYERLADLEPAASPLDSAAYRPALASGWERIDSLTWRFRLRPAANERRAYHKARSRAATKKPSPPWISGIVRRKRPWAKGEAQVGGRTGWKVEWF